MHGIIVVISAQLSIEYVLLFKLFTFKNELVIDNVDRNCSNMMHGKLNYQAT
jgi:hypothetical protein